LADNGGQYGFVDATTQTVLPAYTAIQGLVSDASAIGLPPVPYTQDDLPSIGALVSRLGKLARPPLPGSGSGNGTATSGYDRTAGQ